MQYTKFGFTLLFAALCALHVFCGEAAASTVVLNWARNSETDVVGYRVRYGTSAGSYTQTADVGNTLAFSLPGALSGHSYFFVVVAYNSSGSESLSSAELRVDVPASPTPTPTATVSPTPNPTPPPTSPPTVTPTASPTFTPLPREVDNDGDGIPDSLDPDDDNDGLSDDDELARGTNPLDSDTDHDGVSDGQEVSDGTDPLDPGSGEALLGHTVNTEWNGYLGGMWNIAELVDLGNSTVNANLTLSNQSGAPQSQVAYDIPSGHQQDSLVHQMPGWAHNAYGSVRIAQNGAEGDIDGRMVYYKPASTRTAKLGESYDFAFALPYSNGKRGPQYVFFDTFQRSLYSSDRNNLVADWIQVTNLGSETSGGVLREFASNGALLGQTPLVLSPGQRMDIAAHQYGKNQLGIVEWLPDRVDVPFQLRNTHYLYDNVGTVNSFASGFQQEGAYPTGKDLLVPITTENSQSAYLQVSNTGAEARSTTVYFFDSNGASLLAPITVNVAPKGSWSMALDPAIKGKAGFALIKGTGDGRLVAGAVEFLRNRKKSIAYMYLVPGKVANGTVLRGSYNTYLGQRSSIVVMNSSDVAQALSLDVMRSDGARAMAAAQYVLPPHGMQTITVPTVNSYGVVTVQGQINNSLVSWVVRSRPDFVIPTPVRQ